MPVYSLWQHEIIKYASNVHNFDVPDLTFFLKKYEILFYSDQTWTLDHIVILTSKLEGNSCVACVTLLCVFLLKYLAGYRNELGFFQF